ncbi:chemotaxis protein CheW [Massilia phosphatilytica]|nr:chemotaxis protein CheW [Massilia phosphatilytica]
MAILRKGSAMHMTTTTTTQFLSFTLGGLEYGLDVAKVQELRVLKALERFTSDGAMLKGVAVSRGVIMPLVDMRAACGTSPGAPDPMTDVIILRLSTCTMGIVVDGVTGVVSLAPEQVSPVPGADQAQVDYLIGLGQMGTRRLILVDIDRLMSVRRPKKDGARHVA